MKTIGLIGGMSWESTVTYYQIINRVIKEKCGAFHSAKCIIYSVDFQEIEECQSSGNWKKSGEILADAARNLERAGADFLVICTNTMHKVVPQIEQAVSVPILHIADVTLQKLKKADIRKTALLGTKYTMEQDFYKERLTANGVGVVIPDAEDREIINGVIYSELCAGTSNPESQRKFLHIINKLKKAGAEAVILGCTEIGLLIHQQDTDLPVFDTALIHAEEAALYSIE